VAPSTSWLLYATNHSVAHLCVRALLFPTSVSSLCLQRQLLITIPVLSPWFPRPPFPHSSKMFIGGLNWDTTDGILVYAAVDPHTRELKS
jgi:hypothetical protein